MKKINVFILAAGLGERLRPITNHIPKPLLPLLGQPMLEKVLARVSSVDPQKIGINMHYKWELIEQWAAATPFRDRISLFHENRVLGTGGALKNAAPFLMGSAFIVHNADIISDLSLEQLIDEHFRMHNAVTLAVHNASKYSNVWIDDYGQVLSVGSTGRSADRAVRSTAFTGIAIYSPEFLDILPEGSSNVVDAWLQASSAGLRIGTKDFTGCFWQDIGTPEAYFNAVLHELKTEGEVIYVHPETDCSRIIVRSHAVVERNTVFQGSACINRSLLLPGTTVKTGESIDSKIAGPDYQIDIKETDIMLNRSSVDIDNILILKNYYGDLADDLEISEIGAGGSDRTYFRVKDKHRTAVLMADSGPDIDYSRQMAYTGFFRKYDVPVPAVLREDADQRQVLFEDLGDLSLYSWLKCRKDPEHVIGMYKKVLEILVNLHTKVSQKVSECELLKLRIFDYAHLRWETDYFLDRFVLGLMSEEAEDRPGIITEFERLAEEVDSFSKCIVHRDFQSQNIMITEDGIPRIIDYQGARMGPPAYDLASVLWDPYYRLEDDMRTELIRYYTQKMNEVDGRNFSETEFLATLLPCRLQRHMQALGAYGFLSKVKGKKYFMKHVPQALEYLHMEAELSKTEYPVLYNLVTSLYEKTLH